MHVYTDAVTSAPVFLHHRAQDPFDVRYLVASPTSELLPLFFHLFLTRIVALASPLTATAVDQAVRFFVHFAILPGVRHIGQGVFGSPFRCCCCFIFRAALSLTSVFIAFLHWRQTIGCALCVG